MSTSTRRGTIVVDLGFAVVVVRGRLRVDKRRLREALADATIAEGERAKDMMTAMRALGGTRAGWIVWGRRNGVER